VKLAHRASKPCFFIASSRDDLKGFPASVRGEIGHALREAQLGGEAISAKALKGFGGRGVLEIIEDFDGDTYRAVYTVRFAGVIYVLHAFQKKSKRGIATPKQHVALVTRRLRIAQGDYRTRFGNQGR
jgi:phage-related protein